MKSEVRYNKTRFKKWVNQAVVKQRWVDMSKLFRLLGYYAA
jgi:hypothetical protein